MSIEAAVVGIVDRVDINDTRPTRCVRPRADSCKKMADRDDIPFITLHFPMANEDLIYRITRAVYDRLEVRLMKRPWNSWSLISTIR